MNPLERSPEDPQAFFQTIEELFRSQQLGVLSTSQQGRPYVSLVAFASTRDLKTLLFATTRATRKFENLTRDSQVAILIDNRENQIEDFRKAVAVTAFGQAAEVPESEREEALACFLEKHPHLQEFVTSPTCALVGIKVSRYSLVRRFQEVLEMDMPT